MSKYSEALKDIVDNTNINPLYYGVDTIKEAIQKAEAIDELIELKMVRYSLPNGKQIIGFDYTPKLQEIRNEYAKRYVDDLVNRLKETSDIKQNGLDDDDAKDIFVEVKDNE